MSLLSLLLVLATASAQFAGGDPTLAPPPRPKPFTQEQVLLLIDDLGSEDYQVREDATQALKRRPEAALALLRANRTTTNPETLRRLASILPVMMNRETAEARLDRLPEYVKKRQLDRIVETMVACREFIRPQDDEQIREFVASIYEEANQHLDPSRTLRKLPAWRPFTWRNRYGASENSTMVIETTARGCEGMIVSERIEGDASLRMSITLSNGRVDLPVGSASNGLLITTGIVDLGNSDSATIISKGAVQVSAGGPDSFIISGGVIRAFGDQKWPIRHGGVIRENDKKYFETWNLLELERMGASVTALFGVVRIHSVSPKSLFGRSGFRQGDIIVHAHGRTVSTVDDFKRLLCRASVTWLATDVAVLRDGRELTIRLALNPDQ